MGISVLKIWIANDFLVSLQHVIQCNKHLGSCLVNAAMDTWNNKDFVECHQAVGRLGEVYRDINNWPDLTRLMTIGRRIVPCANQ